MERLDLQLYSTNLSKHIQNNLFYPMKVYWNQHYVYGRQERTNDQKNIAKESLSIPLFVASQSYVR